jgi:hypothetical protein
MSLPTQALDDKTFDDLVGEAIALLPTLAPEWTNHNPSDPGITLIELLAYFTEILFYQLGRVTPATKLQFLKLLAGAGWEGLTWDSKLRFLRCLMGNQWDGWKAISERNDVDLEKEIDCAVIQASPAQLENGIEYVLQDLLRNDCAVTAPDFERITYEVARETLGAEASIRALCVPSANLENVKAMSQLPDDPGHVSMVLVPRANMPGDSLHDLNELYEKVRESLSSRSLLTTRVHVLPPFYLHLAIGLKIVPRPDQLIGELPGILREMLEQRFGAERGRGPLGKGWPFGRALRISELIEAIDDATGVDYVESVTILQVSADEKNLNVPAFALGLQIGLRSSIGVDSQLGVSRVLGPDRIRRNEAGKLAAVVLRPWELLRVTLADADLNLMDQQAVGTGNGTAKE